MTNENLVVTASSSDSSLSVQHAARRLRRVQISFADESPSKRRAYIVEELDSIIKTVPIDSRAGFLGDLESIFPALTSGLSAVSTSVESVCAPQQLSVDELVSELAERTHSMGNAEKEALIDRLAGLGLCRVAAAPPTHSEKLPSSSDGESATVRESIKYVTKALHLERVDVPRLANAFVMLVVYMGQLDDTVWRTWQEVAQKPGLRRKVRLDAALRSYISGDSSIKGTVLNLQIKSTVKLLVAFIAAIGKLGGQLSKQHLAQFDPQEIQIVANRGGGSLLMSQDAVCWSLYKNMANRLSEDSVDDAVRNILSAMIVDLMTEKG